MGLPTLLYYSFFQEVFLLKKTNIGETVAQMLESFLNDQNLELIDVEYKKEGKKWYLRVFIDKSGGIQLTDCEAVSEFLSPKLDTSDLIPHHYILEVSSPGIERPLRKPQDFIRFRGSQVCLRTLAPIGGKKQFQGVLLDLIDDQVILETCEGRLSIPYVLIGRARLKVF